MSELDDYLVDNADRFQEAMFELLRIPSVSRSR